MSGLNEAAPVANQVVEKPTVPELTSESKIEHPDEDTLDELNLP